MAQKRRVAVEAWDYVLKADRELPVEEQARFRLTPLTLAEYAAVEDGFVRRVVTPEGATEIQDRGRQTAVQLCLTHIESIENCPASVPEPWPANQAARARYLLGLGMPAIEELGDEIYGRAVLGEPEKNS